MPVTVQGPDGQRYQFPDGTTKDTAVAYFKKKGIGMAGTPGTPPPSATFGQRFKQAVGIPSTSELQSMPSKPGISDLVAPGSSTAAKIISNYVRNLASTGKETNQGVLDAVKNIRAGQPVGPNVGKAASHQLEFLLRGVLGPVGGEATQTGGEDFARGNYAGAAGSALGNIVNLGLLKAGRGPTPETAINKLSYAAGKDTLEPISNTFRPDLKTAAQSGRPTTIDSFLSVVNRAKDTMNRESGAAIFPIQHNQILPSAVSQRIQSLIKPNMIQTAAGRAEIARINRAALDFQKPWTIGQLDAERMEANARLYQFEKKGSADQYAALTKNRSLAIDKAIADGIRESVYPIMDRSAGKPQGFFADLKRRQGDLINLQDSLESESTRLKDVSARIKGAPRLSSENVSLYGHPSGGMGASVHRLQNVFLKPNPLASANKRVAQGFSTGRPIPKAIINTLPFRQSLFPQQEEK